MDDTRQLETDIQKLTEELQFLRSAVEGAADMAFWATLADCRLFYANAAAAERLGYPREQLIGRQMSDINPELGNDHWKDMTDRLRSGTPLTVESVLQAQDGTAIPIELTAQMVHFGNEACIVAFARDISEHQRTAKALSFARQAAKAASRAKNDFLATMGHEIRTPLNSVLGMTHLALQTDLDDQQRQYIGKAHRSAEILADVLNDILYFSKLESGELVLEHKEFHVIKLIQGFETQLRTRARTDNIEVRFDIADAVPDTVVGDPGVLEELLSNLGSNAVKFTPSGGTVSVAAEVSEKSNDVITLRFDVRDTGIGISDDDQNGIFEPFRQVDSSISREYGGTGLGLAIASKLSQSLGGKIWVNSTPKQGSCFSFSARFARAKTSSGMAGDSVVASELQRLPGVNVAQGLVATQGKSTLYRHLLLRFRDQQSEFCNQFRAALVSDPATAAGLAHALKGVAANLGMTTLQQHAARLESNCRATAGYGPEIESTLAVLEPELERVLAGLARLDTQTKAETPGPLETIDEQQLGKLLLELRNHLTMHNLAATDTVAALQELLSGDPRSERLDNVAAALAGYDFDTALRRLVELE